MKPYGLPRIGAIEWPDLADIIEFGRPGRVGNLTGKGGDIRSHFKSARKKASVRRYFKRRERKKANREISEETK